MGACACCKLMLAFLCLNWRMAWVGDLVGGEDPAFGFWGAGAVDVSCGKGFRRWRDVRREGGEDVSGWGGVVELEAAEEGEGVG